MGLRRGTAGARSVLGVAVAAAAVVVATAGAAPSNVDIELNLGASSSGTGPPRLVPNGETVNVSGLAFVVHLEMSLITLAPGGRPKVRVELGGGLRWGSDNPDPGEGCTSTPTTGECQAVVDLQPIVGQSGGGWVWDVVAPQSGTYTFKGELFGLAQPDPVLGNNASTITIVVSESTGGGGGSGGGGGDEVVVVTAGAASLAPTRPRAGGAVTASVRVRAGGEAIRPTRVACTGAVGATRVAGAARAASGSASCTYRTPRSAKGKLLRGSVAFSARGQRFTKRFAVRLR